MEMLEAGIERLWRTVKYKEVTCMTTIYQASKRMVKYIFQVLQSGTASHLIEKKRLRLRFTSEETF